MIKPEDLSYEELLCRTKRLERQVKRFFLVIATLMVLIALVLIFYAGVFTYALVEERHK
jgi:hypothetical protein